MCCCGKPTINGETGYRWNDPNSTPGVYPVNPPDVQEGETILYDEPGAVAVSIPTHTTIASSSHRLAHLTYSCGTAEATNTFT